MLVVCLYEEGDNAQESKNSCLHRNYYFVMWRNNSSKIRTFMFSPRNSFDGVNICFIKDEDLLFYVSQTDQAFQMILFSGD